MRSGVSDCVACGFTWWADSPRHWFVIAVEWSHTNWANISEPSQLRFVLHKWRRKGVPLIVTMRIRILLHFWYIYLKLTLFWKYLSVSRLYCKTDVEASWLLLLQRFGEKPTLWGPRTRGSTAEGREGAVCLHTCRTGSLSDSPSGLLWSLSLLCHTRSHNALLLAHFHYFLLPLVK